MYTLIVSPCSLQDRDDTGKNIATAVGAVAGGAGTAAVIGATVAAAPAVVVVGGAVAGAVGVGWVARKAYKIFF